MFLRADLIRALQLLTRLPTGWLGVVDYAPGALGRSIPVWPLVGALIGAVGGAVALGGERLGLSPLLSAIWALAVQCVLTGALHEDGLADSVDGLFGGRTIERRLDIMRDSRVGSYGVIALCLTFGIRAAAIGAIPHTVVLGAMTAAGALSRTAMLLPMVRLRPARQDGMAAGLGHISSRLWGVAVLLGALVSVMCVGREMLPIIVLTTLVAAIGTTWAAGRLIGGYTGDIFGSTAVLAECAALTLMAS